MDTIIIDRKVLENREDCMTDYDLDMAIDHLNYVLDLINDGKGYKEGVRNNTAVDLCCCCYALGLKWQDIVDQINFSEIQRSDFKRRAGVIEGYLDYWDEWGVGGTLDYLMLPYMNHSMMFVRFAD